jgi:hypothetical protein
VAALCAAAALALPAVAAAEGHHLGHYAGDDGVGFQVRLSQHGTPLVDHARYHAHHGFEPASAHGERFSTCARARTNSVQFREFCIQGQFGEHNHAWGTVEVFHGVYYNGHGHVAQKPFETHHWRAVHAG